MNEGSFAVVVNANSGTAASLGEAALHALIAGIFGPKLLTCEIAESEFIDFAMSRAFASEAPIVVIIGGDGTCRAAAGHALDAKKTLAFLPGGTMNLIPNRHWPQMDVASALQALSDGAYENHALDVGYVNDEIFLIAAAFGAAPALARLREAHRASHSLSQSIETLLEVKKVMPHILRPTVSVEAVGMHHRRLSALAIVIGNADIALGRHDPESIIVDQSSQHQFECVAAEVVSPWSFLMIMIRAFLDRNWRDDPKVTTTTIQSGIVRSKSRSIAMTLDGEVHRLTSPAHVRLIAEGLKVLIFSQPSVQEKHMSHVIPEADLAQFKAEQVS